MTPSCLRCGIAGWARRLFWSQIAKAFLCLACFQKEEVCKGVE
jgi:hypothetical protein